MASNGGYQDVGTNSRKRPTTPATKAGVQFWGDYPDAYDTVVIAGSPLPGLCVLKGKGYEMRAHHKKVPGKNGETVTFMAHEPAEWSVHVMMTSEEHLRAFEKIIPIIKPPAKPKPGPGLNAEGFTFAFAGMVIEPKSSAYYYAAQNPTAPKDKSAPSYVSISHPLLALFRITHCRIVGVSLPEQKEDKGMWEVEIKCREHVLDGARPSKTTTTGDAGRIAPRKTAYDNVLSPPDTKASPAATNTGPT